MVGHAPDVQRLRPRLSPIVSTRAQRRLFNRENAPVMPYQGLGPDRLTETLAMFGKLAERMKSGSAGWYQDDDGPIPAGYTYLAQLVAHDFVQSNAPLPPLGGDEPLDRDFRAMRMVLDTIYGGGPATAPLPYDTTENLGLHRNRLRLGHVRGPEPPPSQPPGEQLTGQPRRDLARSTGACPYAPGPAKFTADTLIADPRNDQHVIIAQMTALFHEMHNLVVDRIEELVRGAHVAAQPIIADREEFPGRGNGLVRGQADLIFVAARKVVALVYRQIVVQDLLARLLDPLVWRHYTLDKRPLIDARDPVTSRAGLPGNRVPVEFSHAAYRIGHVMVRFSYRLNDALEPNPSLQQILDRASGARSDLVPLACDWLVDWSHFFEMDDGKRVNRARRIRPYTGNGALNRSSLLRGPIKNEGSLFYRDLVRGLEAGVGTVAGLIARLPDEEWCRSELLRNPNYRAHTILTWLQEVPVGLGTAELTSLSEDPPLFFFLLFEAFHDRNGDGLGKLGSIIVAEVLFRGLVETLALIEDDDAVSPLAAAVFGGPVPQTMPDLIRFMRAHGCLGEVSCPLPTRPGVDASEGEWNGHRANEHPRPSRPGREDDRVGDQSRNPAPEPA